MSESSGELILYTDPNGTTRLQVRLVDGTVWLSQALMASLYGKDVRTINEHLRNIYEEGELAPEATIRNFRIVQIEGTREVSREIAHYSLPAILAVGSVRQAPVVVNGEIRVGTRMKATLSVDHRVSDGAEGARFLQTLAKYLESPVRLLI